jgi:hypothetical protein
MKERNLEKLERLISEIHGLQREKSELATLARTLDIECGRLRCENDKLRSGADPVLARAEIHIPKTVGDALGKPASTAGSGDAWEKRK